ncbi:T9SS type A sorting domain-containing protein [Aurantibacillus circumpalustris]|uniref:T9SS type A sorting domain-containing protein n=1 Tax=Aurantibacillus circumpalustris TaxID=3036359 RepID=UPI00295B11D8|nr:T9SS type A sorting domain-containing protein [Aurantibacillus circumpalustris]
MKKLLLPFILLILINKTPAQVVFCPAGAEWNYYFNAAYGGGFENETIKYLRDTIIGADTIKLLKSSRLYADGNPVPPNFLTHIKQKGDTIFFNNFSTQYTWQILYNFAAQVNEGWHITHIGCPVNSILTSSYNVVSISSVVENNMTLKKLNMGVFTVTERFGSSGFLFLLSNKGNCHTDQYVGSLCYKDNSFGLKQFSSYPCDYSNTVGVSENELNKGLRVFPNPTNGKFTFESATSEMTNISIHNALGELVYSKPNQYSNNQIDLSFLPQGIYYLSAESDKIKKTIKVVKN